MNFRKHAALPFVALALTLPVMAQANSLYHPASGEAGFTEHLDHLKSTKTRAQVMAELEAARKELADMLEKAFPGLDDPGRHTPSSPDVEGPSLVAGGEMTAGVSISPSFVSMTNSSNALKTV